MIIEKSKKIPGEIGNKEDIESEEKILISELKSIFILLFICDIRIQILLLSDWLCHKLFSERPQNINIPAFINQCRFMINDFMDNVITFTDIGFYATIEWTTNCMNVNNK